MISYHAGSYDAVVVGAGHAGCEAALALARIGYKTLLLTINLDSVAHLACNPSIGGTAKGHIVREVDALGGEMGVNADAVLLQQRMLNLAKGPAVHSLRGQADKNAYHRRMKSVLENTPGLTLRQEEAVEVLTAGGRVSGVRCASGGEYACRAAVLATGVYLKSDVIIGEWRSNSGPAGFFPANRLTASLLELGFQVRRFKTGTPARLDRRSIDFTNLQRQDSDTDEPFSFLTDRLCVNELPCYLTYTNRETHEIIRQNLHRSPMYNGEISGVGPRYCPSIESKVVRFADKERHQVFLEPEGADTNETYVQGMSTSLPAEVQQAVYRTIPGLERAVIMRYAYAIEYDCIDPRQLYPTMQYKEIPGLYTAGQINGSSGYEEAAGQGILAGINAARYLGDSEQVILGRGEAYIGVLADDLTVKGTDEPYRMMTARAEYRLHLRQDNADQRLTELGRRVGLVDGKRYDAYCRKMEQLNRLKARLSPAQIASVKRGETPLSETEDELPQKIRRQAEIELRYEGYLAKQEQEIARAARLEQRMIPEGLDYASLKGLRLEARQKLAEIRPRSVGQASRISGVSPADIAVLLLCLGVKAT